MVAAVGLGATGGVVGYFVATDSETGVGAGAHFGGCCLKLRV